MDQKTQAAAVAALKILAPLLEHYSLQELRRFLDGRVDNIVKSDEAHGWSATHQGDPKNDYPGDILAKRADNMLFVLAQQLPGKLSDGFRDAISPLVTPNVRAAIFETDSAEAIARVVVSEVYYLAEAALKAVAP